MPRQGVMYKIKHLLADGMTTRDVINLGYKPGSVYGAKRKLETQESLAEVPRQEVRPKDFLDLWHSPAPLVCPGCSSSITHWFVCKLCGRLFPAECGCSEESEGLQNGFLITDLEHSPSRATSVP